MAALFVIMVQFIVYSLAALIGIFSVAALSIEEEAVPSPAAVILSDETVAVEEVVPPPVVVEENAVLYQVVKVTDGDTITIMKDNVAESVRLIGVDTPETVHPSKPVQCFGKEASAQTKSWLEGARVSIEIEASQGERDKYGRLLGYMFRDDGFFVNLELIKQGYAHEYTYNLPYQYQTEFKAAEQVAKAEGRGLWGEGVCVTKETSTTPITSTPVSSQSPQCTANIYNCGDFKSQAEAQAVFMECGGVNNDIHRLDSDGDGEACESL